MIKKFNTKMSEDELIKHHSKIYKSYWREDLTFSCCEADKVEQIESSY